MGSSDLKQTVRGVGLLAELTDAAVDELVAASAVVEVVAGQTLFSEGDPGDSLYILLAGHVAVLADGGTKRLRALGRGDSLGEISLITGAARTASARVTRDLRALRVPRSVFLDLVLREPRLAVRVADTLAKQLAAESAVASARRAIGVAALVDLTTDAGITSSIVSELPRTAVIDRRQFGPDVARVLEDAESRGSVVLAAGSDDDDWRSFCLRSADTVVVVGADRVDAAVAGTLPADLTVDFVGVKLPPEGRWPDWASDLHPRARHRLDGSDASAARLARRLSGSSPGIVLSGGGARGLAHLGVLLELERAGLWPERWGGTSMGAFVGALGASGRTASEIAGVCRAELVDRRPFRDYTFHPQASLIRAIRARRMLERVFGTRTRIEDLDRDYFCVTADLDTGELAVHREGRVVDLVGASMSVPGIAPPVRLAGRLHVDGGVLNNLPVDVIVQTGEGPVVAVDVMRRASPVPDDVLPSLLDVIGRALSIGGRQRVVDNLALADVVISPELGGLGLLDFASAPVAVRAGRTAANGMLPALAALWDPVPAGVES